MKKDRISVSYFYIHIRYIFTLKLQDSLMADVTRFIIKSIFCTIRINSFLYMIDYYIKICKHFLTIKTKHCTCTCTCKCTL